METTYKMIGGDGREYGPASLEELCGWIREGRVAPATQVWRSDTGCWQPAQALPELAGDLAKVAPFLDPSATSEGEPVGFWIRFAAYWIDQVLLAVVLALITQAPELPTGATPSHDQIMEFLRAFARYSAISLLVSGLYYVLLTAHFGATLGKLIFRARVVKADGSPVGYGTALVRFLGSIVSGMILCIGYLMVAFREDKRALHDLMAGTRVEFRRD